MSTPLSTLFWVPGTHPVDTGDAAICAALSNLATPFVMVDENGAAAVATGGRVALENDGLAGGGVRKLLAFVPALLPEHLGSPAFREIHGLRYAYVMGAMANGITSVEMVKAAGEAGMIGFFGAAGLSVAEVERAVDRLDGLDIPYGFNLIHSPYEPELESATVDLYLRRGVRMVSASAFLGLTLPLIRYRLAGIGRDPAGNIVCRNRIVAKVSREEVASRFLSPAPEKFLRELVAAGDLTEAQARMAESVPVAGDMTAEADSGGHTDNRPAITLLPTCSPCGMPCTAVIATGGCPASDWPGASPRPMQRPRPLPWGRTTC